MGRIVWARAANALLVVLIGSSPGFANPKLEQIPPRVQAKFDSFFACMQTDTATRLSDGRLSFCGVKTDKSSVQCLKHHTKIETPFKAAEWQVGAGRTVYAVGVWCPHGGNLGVQIEQMQTGELVASIIFPIHECCIVMLGGREAH